MRDMCGWLICAFRARALVDVPVRSIQSWSVWGGLRVRFFMTS